MYQSQQFHTSSYRGNQQGHDSYLRSDSPSPSSYGTQSVTSQYRGRQKTFQPTGLVSSVYGQTANQGMGQQQQTGSFGITAAQNYHTAGYRGDQQGHDSYLRSDSSQPSQSQFGGISGMGQSGFTPSASAESFHTAGYRGDQQGHDSYLRSDSRQPSQSQFGGISGMGSSGAAFGIGPGMSNFGSNISSFNQTQQSVSPESFHTAGYRGDQQGHDSYLRSDSRQPSQSQLGIGSSGTAFGISGPGMSNFGSNISSFNQTQQSVSPESFHTASYRGDQQGHDSYLRSDSRQPTQSQFETSGAFSTNRF